MPCSVLIKPIQSARRSDIVLGVCLRVRSVGLVLTSRDRIIRFRVLNLNKIRSLQGREQRFGAVLANLLDDYSVARMALAVNKATPLLGATLACLRDLAARRRIRCRAYEEAELRRAVGACPEKGNRPLAERLIARYPELRLCRTREDTRVARALALGTRPSSIPSAQERYWRPMFLALAVALHDFDPGFLSHLGL